jgi:hypothetical protein
VKWWRSWKADPVAVAIAADHYSRRRRARPTQRQWCPPGRGVPLRVLDWTGTALWHTHWPAADLAMHGRGDAWICSIFRNLGAGLSSALIVDALAVTRDELGDPPAGGTITFVDETEIQSPNPGYCFKVVGFRPIGRTKDRGLLTLWLPPDEHPPPAPPVGRLRPGCGTLALIA